MRLLLGGQYKNDNAHGERTSDEELVAIIGEELCALNGDGANCGCEAYEGAR